MLRRRRRRHLDGSERCGPHPQALKGRGGGTVRGVTLRGRNRAVEAAAGADDELAVHVQAGGAVAGGGDVEC